MTLTQIRYVVETSKTGSISRAALNLFISQSVVSNAISGLEKEFGSQIFMRSATGVSLTPFGKAIIPYLLSIESQVEQLDRVAGNKAASPIMSLSVASISYPFVVAAYTKLFNAWKGAGIHIDHFNEDELGVISLVASRTADVGILRIWSCYKPALLNQLKAQGLQFFSLGTFKVGVTVGEGSQLLHRKEDYLLTDDLKGLPSVLYRSTDIGPYSDIFTQLKLAKAQNKIVTSSRAAIAEILASTDCYLLDTVLPGKVSSEIADLGRRRRTFFLKDTSIYSELGWLKRKDSGLSSVTMEFIENAAEYLQ